MSESELNPNQQTPPGGQPSSEEAQQDQERQGEGIHEEAPVQEEPSVDPRDEQISQLQEEQRKLLYQLAEMQNIIKRTKAQAEQDRRYATESLAVSLLPVLDGFERTFAAAAKGASVESLAEGVRVIDKQMRKALESVGVQRIVSLGAPFDPVVHEALDTVESAELDEDTVVDELEAGYQLQDRIIRPAKVRVSRKP